MDIYFKSKKLARILASEAEIRRSYPHGCTQTIKRRMDMLRAAQSLSDFSSLPGNCHELKGKLKGQLALELPKGYRLVFEPQHNPPPTKNDGGLDWNKVTKVTVLDICDYHR